MNINPFTWIPPQHNVLKAQRKLSMRPNKDTHPWVFVDWWSVSSDYWWIAPVSNTGVKSPYPSDDSEQKTIIDTLSMTFSPDLLGFYGSESKGMSRWLFFYRTLLDGSGLTIGGVTGRKTNGYEVIHNIYEDNGKVAGFIGYGSEIMRGRSQIYMDGACCQVINEINFFPEIHDRLSDLIDKVGLADTVRITRCDIAYDDLEGDFSIEQVDKAYDEGLFNGNGRRPKSGLHGNWKEGNSRTFEVGSRMSRRFWRSYEKGNQLGDIESPWVRHELEMKREKSSGFEIPLDVLVVPDSYFSGSYLFSSLLVQSARPKTIHSVTATKAKITVESSMETLTHQWGRWFAFYVDVLKMSPEAVIERVIKRDGQLPRRLDQHALGATGQAIREELMPF